MFGHGGQPASAASTVSSDWQPYPSSPKRTQAIPNSRGDNAIYTISTQRSSGETTVETRVLDLRTNTSKSFTKEEGVREVQWLGIDDDVIWLRDALLGSTEIWIAGSGEQGQKPYCAGRIGSRAFHLRLKRLKNEYNDIAIAVGCPVTVHGGLLASSGNQSNPDQLVRNAIWYTTLRLKAIDHITKPTRYAVNPSRWTNALQGTQLACPLSTSSSPSTSPDFDISSTGIAFLSQDTLSGSPNFPSINTYFLSIRNFSSPAASTIPIISPHLLNVPAHEGPSSHPIFSPTGIALAFLKKKHPIDRNDRNRLIVINHVSSVSRLPQSLRSSGPSSTPTPDPSQSLDPPSETCTIPMKPSKQEWHLSPYSIAWADSGKEIYAVAVDQGMRKLYKVPARVSEIDGEVKPVTSDGGTPGDVRMLRMVFSAPMDVKA